MTTQPLDHAIAGLLLIVAPLWSWQSYTKMKREMSMSKPGARLKQYRQTILIQWAVAAVMVGVWLSAARPLSALGVVVAGGPRLLVGVVATAAIVYVLGSGMRKVFRLAPERLAAMKGRIGDVLDLLPVNTREMSWFVALSVTAGIVEEVVYRGFLLWYFGQFTGVWLAVIVAAAIFGAGHSYQGRKGVVKTATVGVFMGALYLVSGSLLWPAIVHATVDVQGGTIGLAIARGVRGGTLASATA